MTRDINNREDIEKLMVRFYEYVLDDMIIGFIFTDIVDFDLEGHLPIITDFWETVLFGTGAYKRKTKVFDVHKELNEKLPLKKGHFNRWLYLFDKSVDEMYSGPYAEKAKEKASVIAEGMQKRLQLPECSNVT